MPMAKMSSKGQITVPVEVRRALSLDEGSRVNFVLNADGVYELVPETGSVTALKGMLSSPRGPVTIEEMNEAIADSAVESMR